MTRSYVILDGLQDHTTAQSLSAAWAKAGLFNTVDPAGQCAWLTRTTTNASEPVAPSSPAAANTGSMMEPEAQPSWHHPKLDETEMTQATNVAAEFGLVIRDRIGNTFRSDVEPAMLRSHLAWEYRSRLATALVFGLPAIVLHYLGPVLAGGAIEPRSLAYAWMIEAVLVTWGCLAAGWPVFWQGMSSLARGRTSGDAFTTLIVLAAWGPSMVGLMTLLFTTEPWFIGGLTGGSYGGPHPGVPRGPGFHAAMVAVIVAVLQRWLAYRSVDRLAGRADLMIPRWHKLVSAWVLLCLVIMLIKGWFWGLAMAMLLPPMAGLGAINPWSPGWSALLPVFGFAGLFLLGPTVMRRPIDDVVVEIAFGFNLVMTSVFVAGWRAWPMRAESVGVTTEESPGRYG